MKELFENILSQIQQNRDAILVTLIDNDGSAPRKTGAQMLVGNQGLIYGSIGGGAVELRSVKKSQVLLKEKCSAVHPFILHTNEKEDIGMICGGNVTAYFQFIGAGDILWKELCEEALSLFKQQKGGWFVQNIRSGKPALLDENKDLLKGFAPTCEIPAGTAPGLIDDTFWMPIPVKERVLIFGAGHIAAALVPLLNTVGFRSSVIDYRQEYLTRDRFPLADELILCDFSRIGDFIKINEKDYIVIMTNGHKYDFEAELFTLRGSFSYIGVIGSRRKTAAVNARLREQGISEETIAKVHTPIGTPIKAVTPEEIAVSIAGELILVRAERR